MGNLLIPWHQVGIYQRSQAGFSNLHCYSDLNAPRERCLETRSVEFMRISPLPAIVNFAPPKKNHETNNNHQMSRATTCIAIQHFLVNGWACWNSSTWPIISGMMGQFMGQLVPATIPLLRVAPPEIQAKNTISWKIMVGRLLSFWKRPMFRGYVLPFLGRVFGIIGRKVKNLTFYWTVNSDFWSG